MAIFLPLPLFLFNFFMKNNIFPIVLGNFLSYYAYCNYLKIYNLGTKFSIRNNPFLRVKIKYTFLSLSDCSMILNNTGIYFT